MSVTISEVERIASLARLSFSGKEKEKMAQELNEILCYMELLNTIDTAGVEPLSHVISLDSEYREDEIQPCVSHEEALKNAPARTEEYFRVPKVIGER